MVKLAVWILVILVLALSSVYFLVPATIKISTLTGAQATIHGESRSINNEEKWDLWWKDVNETPHVKGEPFFYDGVSFKLTKKGVYASQIQIECNGLRMESILHLVTFSVDSTGASWYLEMPKTNNPINRMKYYQTGRKIRNAMWGVMKNFSNFISHPRNIYGFEIYRTSTRDTTLLSTRFTSKSFPGTKELYKYFSILEKNIEKQKSTRTGYPMMNVVKLSDSLYETQVALPTNHTLKNNGDIVYRYMVPGNFFGGDVKGGQLTVNEAQRQLDMFILDYNKSKMANAYQMLVTDRSKEPDTLKWITQLRIPVVE